MAIEKSDRIGRAFAEFVIVVVGVLVALAADGWLESREVEAQREQLVDRLVTDLRADSALLAELLAGVDATVAAGRRLVLDLDQGIAVPADSLSRLVHRFSRKYQFPRTRRGVYAEFSEAQAYVLLEPSVRERITNHYEALEFDRQLINEDYRSGWAPWVHQLPSSFRANPETTSLETLRSVVFEDPENQSQIREHLAFGELFVILHRSVLGRVERLLVLLSTSR